MPQDTVIRLESVAAAEPLPNLAVLRAGPQSRAEQGREVRIEVEVGNYSATARQVQVEVVLGDASYRADGICAAGDKTVLVTLVQPRAPGWVMGEARLLGVQDALAADNSRSFAFEVRPAPTYALVTHQRAEQRPSSSYYLERALAPFQQRAEQTGSRVIRHDPARLDRESLANADVIVLDHPGKLSGEAIQLIAMFLRRGRGLLYVAAEAADAANLKLLADAAGSALQMPVEFAPPSAGQRRRDLFLTEVRRDRSPFSIFGDNLPAVVGSLRFGGGLASHRLEGGLADDVLASFGDRSACLVTTTCGAGVLAVLNADLAASNVPSSPAFVPMLGELMDRLLGQVRSVDSAICGEPLAVYLPAAAGPSAGLTVSRTDRQSTESGQLVEESGGVLFTASAAAGPGIYKVQRGDSTVFAIATGLAAEESDLRPLDPAVFRERLAGGRTVLYRAAAGEEEERDDFWTWLVLGCVVCLLGELVALRYFRT